jgi:hypothetical protein
MQLLANSKIKRLGLGALCSLSLLATTACTDEEVQLAVGAIAIGAGAVIIGDAVSDSRDNHRGHHGRRRGGYSRCVGGYRSVCETYYDYYGYRRESCRSVYDSCASREWVNHHSAGNSMLAGLESDVSSVKWAKHFKMSHKSAVKMIAALKDARDAKGQKLQAMGLTKSDLRVLSRYELPSNQAVDNLAKSLNQRPADTKNMLLELSKQAKLLAN